MAQGKTTTDHEQIRKWADQRDDRPSTVSGTASDHKAGILRLDFGEQEERLEPISWEEFFRKFDKEHLTFLYQDETSDGSLSRFHKFVEGSGKGH